MLRITLRQKIFLGFGFIVALLCGNGLAVYVGSRKTTAVLERFHRIDAVNALLLGLDRDVQELRLRVDRFVKAGSESQSTEAKAIFAKLRERIETADQQLTDTDIRPLFEKIEDQLRHYEKNFEIVISEREIRQVLVMDQIPALAIAVESLADRLANHLASPSLGNDGRLALSRFRAAFSKADKDLLRYFETPDGVWVSSANASIRIARRELQSVLREMDTVDQHELKSAGKSLASLLDEYETVAMRAVQATRSYLYLRNVVLAGEESEVSYYSTKLRKNAEQWQSVITQELASTTAKVRRVSNWIFFMAVGVSVLFATRLAFLIVAPISAITNTFEQLARGSVLSTIPGDERTDEIGMMARAARIFSDQNQRTRELLDDARELGGQLQEKADQLEATNQELDSFAYVASHDLRSPLRGIKHLATWIEDDVAEHLSVEGADYLDQLKRRVGKLEVLLEDLLDFSRVGRLDPTPETVSVVSVIDNLMEMIDNPNNVVVHRPDNMPVIETIRAPLEQVFMNLLGNAIKYNQRGSKGHVWIDWKDDGNRYRFSVRDDGPGISPENHKRVFQMYQRVDSTTEGSGMGLAIVKKQVELFDGKIQIDSSYEKGACFTFCWPKVSCVRKHSKPEESFA